MIFKACIWKYFASYWHFVKDTLVDRREFVELKMVVCLLQSSSSLLPRLLESRRKGREAGNLDNNSSHFSTNSFHQSDHGGGDQPGGGGETFAAGSNTLERTTFLPVAKRMIVVVEVMMTIMCYTE